MHDQLQILRHAALASFADFSSFYTWRTWLFVWLTRLLAQVSFYAFIGRMLGTREELIHLLVGNAVAIVAIDATVVILLTAAERRSGTLALMVAAPSSHLTVYLGRGLAHFASGVLSSAVAFLALPTLFGVGLPWNRSLLVLPMIALVGLSCYAYGTCIASVVLGVPSVRWLALNLSYLTLFTFCGVNVPASFWPRWVEVASMFLPMSHGLLAVREVFNGGHASVIATQLALEFGVGLGWLTLAAVGFNRIATRGRQNGTIELSA